jgi:hypothetical protein
LKEKQQERPSEVDDDANSMSKALLEESEQQNLENQENQKKMQEEKQEEMQ